MLYTTSDMGGGSPPDNLQTRDEEGSLKGFPINLFPECSKKKKKKQSEMQRAFKFPA